MARTAASSERADPHRLASAGARVRTGLRLLGHQVCRVRLVPGIGARRAAYAVHLRRLAPDRSDVAVVWRRGDRSPPRRSHRTRAVTAVALTPGLAALVLF